MATIISEYIRERKNDNFDVENINIENFLVYVNDFGKDKNKIISLSDNYHESSIGYASLIIDLIKLNLTSNNLKDFYKYFYTVLNVDKVELSNKIQKIGIDEKEYVSKEELLKELILTTMKKYPKGYDKNNLNYSGFDYIDVYLSGNIRGVTRNGDLRKRVSEGLSVNDVYDIVDYNGVIGKNSRDKVNNYIKMVMLNEIIRCMSIRMPNLVVQNLNRFMITNDYRLITNKIGSARVLSYTLNGDAIRELLNDLGVNTISEYIERYYNENKNLERGRAS